ncbi:glycoside hydrolase family 43 protein [Clostridium sp. C8-1-8]|uniref:glycoside hydrolase family 43 protein n=1 Tax=Clostridium sp. C8-1-8 TaxID=2698831 RepID=UPI00136E365C|nr:glycoside hydrolase family 43 protein [Clostridium sp. C8-1-8]
MAYLFVHFREKKTPDGEQVYFGLSKDGFHWEKVNDGKPVLWSNVGELGVRDHTICRTKDGHFFILATDLSLARNFNDKYHGSWDEITRNGSKSLVMWESEDLIHWSDSKLIQLADDNYGCVWAPDIIYDKQSEEYVIHWSSSHCSNNYGFKAIYYSKTKDFRSFSHTEMLCRKDNSGIIDSAIYEEDGVYYRFLKSELNPSTMILEKGESLTGPYERVIAFDEEMANLEQGVYEAPTAFKLDDGKWCMMIDYYGVEGDGQGYVPFICEDITEGRFVRSDKEFSFPYGYKHGTVLTISEEEYERIKVYKDWKTE